MIIYNKDNKFTGFGGNIMFQTAATIGLAERLGSNYCLHFNDWLLESFEGDFNFKPVFDIQTTESKRISEPSFSYSDLVSHYGLIYGENYDLTGYFQSEKYFAHLEDRIRQLFVFKRSLYESVYKKYSNVFNLRESGKLLVSVHIRRGDYLKYPDNHPVLPVEYYKNAMANFAGTDCLFVIFGDDPDWAEQVAESIPADCDAQIISGNSAAFDMCFMSLCQAHIIANSTFSWWGAWLSKEVKLVYAPPKSRWFGPAYSSWSVDDLYTNKMIEVDF